MSVVGNAAHPHPWRLVAPWYRWDRFAGVHPRDTPPVIQKYETTDLVKLFRANPQHCLQFTGDDTVVDYSSGNPVDTGRRKLYLPSHKRFYLAVAELHCDRPGFPNASRDAVCEAGFVIRRRRHVVPLESTEAVQKVLRRIGKRRAQVAELERRFALPPLAGGAQSKVARESEAVIMQRRIRAVERLEQERAGLDELMDEVGAFEIVEGWVPSEIQGVGTWQAITDDALIGGTEDTFRMSPMIVPDDGPAHAARGRAMWFGMVPTGSSDHDVDGVPRFDEQHTYELQCFVRRHDPCCPKRPNHSPDCRGEVVMSESTEPFRLAEHFDLIGTANRPVTIQLPDIPALIKQAEGLDYGQGAPVKMKSTDGSAMNFTASDGKATSLGLGAAQICSFAIPLITIVATFVLRLFLPIVILVFGLWALLKLKFCILPQVSISAQIDADFAARPPGYDADASVTAMLTGELVKALGDSDAAAAMGTARSNTQNLEYLHDFKHGPQLAEPVPIGEPGAPESTSVGPNSALAPLVWEKEVKLT